jgi:hypothetical protein
MGLGPRDVPTIWSRRRTRCRLLPGFNGKFQTHRPGYSNQRGQARIAVGGQCPVKALALDARSLGHLGNAAPGFSHPAQSYQEHARFVLVFQRCSPGTRRQSPDSRVALSAVLMDCASAIVTEILWLPRASGVQQRLVGHDGYDPLSVRRLLTRPALAPARACCPIIISRPPRMEIQQGMHRNSSFYHIPAITLVADHSDFSTPTPVLNSNSEYLGNAAGCRGRKGSQYMSAANRRERGEIASIRQRFTPGLRHEPGND